MFETKKFESRWNKDNEKEKKKAVDYLLSCITNNCREIDEIISIIKTEKIFLYQPYYQELISQPYLPQKYRDEFSFLFKINEKLNSERREKDKIIDFFSFDELILEMSLLFEYVRIEEKIPLGCHENLLEVINYILNQKVHLLERSKKKPEPKHQNEDYLILKYFSKIFENLNKNNTQNWNTYKLYEFYQKYASFQSSLDKYCFQQNFELSFFNPKTANFKPLNMQEYELWHRNGLKYTYLANYYDIFGFPLHSGCFDTKINEIRQNTRMNNQNKNAQIKVLCNTYQFVMNGFDNMIVYKDHTNKNFKFSLHLGLGILNTLAGWANDRWNSKIESLKSDNSKSTLEKIIFPIMSVFIPPYISSNPLFLRTYNQFIEQISKTFFNQFEEKEIKSAVNFLTNNLNNQEIEKINLFTKPFIRLGNFVYSFCGLLGNTNFAVLLENAILENDKTNNSYTVDFNEEQTETGKERSHFKNRKEKFVEEKIPNLFETQKDIFSILSSHKFMKKDINGKILIQGDTDCYVYEKGGNKLFIFQVKSTYARHTIQQVSEHKEAVEKAKEQLKKDIQYLRDFDGFDEIKLLLNITQNKFKDLQIIPIIINTNFEYDEHFFFVEGFEAFKISLLELEIILQNTKNFLFNPKEIIQKHYGFIPSEFAIFEGKEETDNKVVENALKRLVEISTIPANKGKFQLREHADCNANDLIDAIKNRRVWDMLPKNFTPPMATITIDNCTLNFYQ